MSICTYKSLYGSITENQNILFKAKGNQSKQMKMNLKNALRFRISGIDLFWEETVFLEMSRSFNSNVYEISETHTPEGLLKTNTPERRI